MHSLLVIFLMMPLQYCVFQHGMGIPSVSILLHEIIKLMYHARVRDPIFFRIGTCGGIGIDGGSVIITEEALNADLKPYQELVSRSYKFIYCTHVHHTYRNIVHLPIYLFLSCL